MSKPIPSPSNRYNLSDEDFNELKRLYPITPTPILCDKFGLTRNQINNYFRKKGIFKEYTSKVKRIERVKKRKVDPPGWWVIENNKLIELELKKNKCPLTCNNEGCICNCY